MARKPLTSFADLASRLRCVFGDLWTGRSADAAALDCLNTWPDPALLTDSSFRLLAANTAFAALVNDTDELLARKTSLPDVLRAWTASSLSAGNDVAAALQAAGDCEYLLHYHAQPYRVRQRRMANGALMLVFSAEAEHRRLQGALEAAETRHGVFVNQLPVGIVLSDASDGRILEINAAARQTLGLPEDIELAALCVSDFYAHADERQSVDKALRQRSGVEERTITLRRFDGLMSSVSLSAKKLGQPGARVVLSAINDVSALQRSTESLQVREKSLHSIVDQLPVAAWLCRPSDGHVLLANNLAHQILDRPNHVLVGGVMPDIFVNPNASAKVESELAVRGRFQNLELHLHMPRLATTRYYLLSATPVEFAGQSALLYSAIDMP